VRDDQSPSKQHWSEAERALFHYFNARCGTTPLQFQCILQNGSFVTLPAQTVVPDTQCTLYLVCQGQVQCEAKFHDEAGAKSFFKRSGQFFDIKLFNLFGLPVGFDNIEFRATTMTPCQLFAWPLDGLVAMRESQSPSLLPYWEYMVLRALTAVAVQHHLKATDTLYDALLLPEDPAWLEGAPSRDFVTSHHEGRPSSSLLRTDSWWRQQIRMVRAAWGQIIPPHGIRHRPGAVTYVHPKRLQLEHQCRAAAKAKLKFSFLASGTAPVPTAVEPEDVPDKSLEDPEKG
jgi:hypothetical protein